MPLEKVDELHHMIQATNHAKVPNDETTSMVTEARVFTTHSDLHYVEEENATQIRSDEDEDNSYNQKHVILSFLKISPIGPRECTIEDILAIQRDLKKVVSDDDSILLREGDSDNIIAQQTENDHEFTVIKAKKMKNKRMETTTIVTRAHGLECIKPTFYNVYIYVVEYQRVF